MEDPTLDTVNLHRCIDCWRGGDRAAADELLRTTSRRLEHLARKMLRGFPNVSRWADTSDVLQGAVLRLLHTLQKIRPDSTRDFFNLAAVHIRRELLDLARHFARRRLTAVPAPDDSELGLQEQKALADSAPSVENLELWCRFHEAVEQLPVEQREVVGLAFYHGWKQKQIAELFGVDERTIRRRWHEACVKLNRIARGELPRG